MSENAMFAYVWTMIVLVALAVTGAVWDATRYESYNETIRAHVGRDIPAEWVKP